jgi:hypothetical protein
MLLSQISKTGDHIIYKKVHFYPLVMNIRKLNEETDSIYKNIKKKYTRISLMTGYPQDRETQLSFLHNLQVDPKTYVEVLPKQS